MTIDSSWHYESFGIILNSHSCSGHALTMIGSSFHIKRRRDIALDVLHSIRQKVVSAAMTKMKRAIIWTWMRMRMKITDWSFNYSWKLKKTFHSPMIHHQPLPGHRLFYRMMIIIQISSGWDSCPRPGHWIPIRHQHPIPRPPIHPMQPFIQGSLHIPLTLLESLIHLMVIYIIQWFSIWHPNQLTIIITISHWFTNRRLFTISHRLS